MLGREIGLAGILAIVFGTARAQQALQQIPNLKELPDVTVALQEQIDHHSGNLELTSKFYRITRPLEFDLQRLGAIRIRGRAGTTLIMDGPGPALRIIGTHEGTASPRTFKPATWNERMPLISGIEILGAHPEADGLELVRTVATIVREVSVRWCRHGLHLVDRNRNVIISDCHLYENTGIGIYLDEVNLHQINISGCHISYNRSGGLVVRNGNVRNIQVNGCDIEGNMPADDTPTRTANILLDVGTTEGDRSNSIAEVSITGCTVQHAANYAPAGQARVAPGGANIRLRGKQSWPIDSVTISGNVLSDTTVNIDLHLTADVTITGNNFFAPGESNMKVTDCQRVVVTGNTFNPRQFVRPGAIRFQDCSDCVLSNNTLHRFAARDGAVILNGCRNCLLSGLLLSNCSSGIVIRRSTGITLSGCRTANPADAAADLIVGPNSKGIILQGCSFAGFGQNAEQQSP